MSRSSPFTLRAAFRRQRVLVSGLLAMLGILAVAAFGAVPLAGYLLAGLLVILAVARIVLPVETVGALAVRTRALDAGGMLVLALGLVLLASAPNL